jgi:hypothetical protein
MADVYEASRPPGNSARLECKFLGSLSPEPCDYDPVDSARALARTPQSVCELVLPLELKIWRTILIDTEDAGTLVMEFPALLPGEQADSSAVVVVSMAEWSARAKTALREWLRLGEPLPPVSHDVPAEALQAAEAWMHSDTGQGMIADAMSKHRVYGRPSLGEPTVEFFITELELALYAESTEPDPTRFDVSPHYVVPVVVEGQEILYSVVALYRDGLGRRASYAKDGYSCGLVYMSNDDGTSIVRPAEFMKQGHVALMTFRDLGQWYHVLGPDGARFTSYGWNIRVFTQAPDGSMQRGDGAPPDVVPLDVFAGWAKPQIRHDYESR